MTEDLEKESQHLHTEKDESCGMCAKEEVKILEEKVQNLEKERLLIMAEAENRCRRVETSSKDREQFTLSSFAKELLVVADSLQCALSGKESEENSAFYKGIQLTSSLLQNVFEKFGVTRITPLHHVFNPELHQAIKEVPDAQHERGIVIEVLQEGYTLHHRVLRAALVVVSSGKEQ
ncbi:protein GrpE [Holospora obtusa F1]|uniref:Protein GrpE n=1 Tax=Holospora obtusa F1 TaxID=1399147 RepID=W6TE75_HOLOB|nr:nucleotide exchange factor GrpE [Holospora obtusa]ETZ07226.1 protein GrpE [Holospora obtusa F1]